MEKTLVIMIGIQGSGKSTFYHKFLKDDFVRVNLDTLKTRHREKLLIEECVENKKSFAVDNTNPTRLDRERYIPLAKAAGYRIVGYFMQSKIRECIKRNNKRQGKEKVPEGAIVSTSNKLEMPSYDEGFDELYFVANDGETMTISEWRWEK
ncbi:MAG: ATP-binding protein [Ruminiclostridium sp.]|nr:ATP-binding protein [Ruminiclostridium sp.]